MEQRVAVIDQTTALASSVDALVDRTGLNLGMGMTTETVVVKWGNSKGRAVAVDASSWGGGWR